ncbi:MAG TPA: DoxX family protein [Bryobacteraceae bacterium]|nr:DoxX family protein [Bryobacteraceae bacterium]
MNVPFLIGRSIFGGYFVYNGINHFKQRAMLAQYAGSKKVPMPEAAVIGSGALMLLGGTSLVLGVQPKLGIAAVAGFLVSVSPVMHDFWRVEDPGQRAGEMVNFSKNMALLGAAFALTGVREPWPASLAHPRPSRVERVRKLVRAA